MRNFIKTNNNIVLIYSFFFCVPLNLPISVYIITYFHPMVQHVKNLPINS